MSFHFIKDPTERAVISNRWSIPLNKIALAVAGASGAAVATGFAARVPDWLGFAIWGATAGATLLAGYLKQSNLPPINPSGVDHD